MDKIEELHLIVELLKKHHLPISPILEYTIKEKEDLYSKELGQTKYVREGETNEEIRKDLDFYCNKFSNLVCNVAISIYIVAKEIKYKVYYKFKYNC